MSGVRRRCARGVVVLAALGMLGLGCAKNGMVDDGTSVSWGRSNGGKLVNGKRLPRLGDGFHVPNRWWQRGNNWGIDEMLRLVAHVGYQVRTNIGSSVGVADISPYRGGASVWHRSHQTGRDVDLIFFAEDRRGNPIQYDDMRRIGPDGRTLPSKDENGVARPAVYFDVERNWQLVRAVLVNPVARIQFIFVSDPLKQKLLDHAIELGESLDLILEASHVLRQPNGALPHDDHFHVRIYCPQSDRSVGCQDTGPLRWTKRDQKYVEGSRRAAALKVPRDRFARARVMMSLGSLPFRGFVPK